MRKALKHNVRLNFSPRAAAVTFRRALAAGVIALTLAACDSGEDGVGVESVGNSKSRFTGPTFSDEQPDGRITWQPRATRIYRTPAVWSFHVHVELTYPVANAGDAPRRIRLASTDPSSPITHTSTRPKVTCNPACTIFEETNLGILPYFLIESAGRPIKITLYTMTGWEKKIEIPAAIVDEFLDKMDLDDVRLP